VATEEPDGRLRLVPTAADAIIADEPLSSEVAKIIEQTLLGEALMEAPIAASVFDGDRRYVAVNEAFCMLTLYTREELTSLKAGTRLAPDKEAREAVRIAVRDHGAAGEANLRRKDGIIVRTAYWVIETKAALMPYYLRFSWLPERVPWVIVSAPIG
jgi:PAS domain S-box-containing protein